MNAQLQQSPAQVYDELFVPALFQQWGEVVADAAGIGTGDRVLDVACGTGALTCAAARRTGGDGSVVGVDINEAMLAVARRKPQAVQWHHGEAESLPFPDGSFDAVVSQFGFMFFADQIAALREMLRVLRPGGRLAVAVCDALDHSPGYAVLSELLQRLFGDDVAQAFRAPFVCGSRELMLALCEKAQVDNARVLRHDGAVRFPSIAALVTAERACVWTLGGLLDEGQFERLLAAAQESLQPFVTDTGQVEFVMPALIVTATKA